MLFHFKFIMEPTIENEKVDLELFIGCGSRMEEQQRNDAICRHQSKRKMSGLLRFSLTVIATVLLAASLYFRWPMISIKDGALFGQEGNFSWDSPLVDQLIRQYNITVGSRWMNLGALPSECSIQLFVRG